MFFISHSVDFDPPNQPSHVKETTIWVSFKPKVGK